MTRSRIDAICKHGAAVSGQYPASAARGAPSQCGGSAARAQRNRSVAAAHASPVRDG